MRIFASVQPCIINSDCCGQQVTVQESCKAVQREEEVVVVVVGEAKIEGDQEIIEYTFSPYICSHTTFFSFWALF